MAYLMTDVAAGSDAALRLQQNMAAAPDVQQAQAMDIQQQQANLERTKLANLVADTGIKADQESKQKLAVLTQSPEFKAADDVKRLQMISAKQFEMGKVEEGAKTLTASELYEAKNIANKQKQLDVQAQQIGNAYGVISAVPDDKVQEFIDRLPEENKKALISQIGEANWNKMTGAEKKEATKNLMLNAKGQMSKQMKEIELEKTQMLNDSRERIARIREDGALARKMMGGTNQDMKEWNTYELRQQAIEKSGQKTLDKLNEKVDTAQGKLDKAGFFNRSETQALERAIKERDAFQRKQIQQQLDLAVSAPKFPGKEIIIDNLKQQLELYPSDVIKPLELKQDTPSAGPKLKYPSDKPNVPSNKDQGTKTAPLPMPKSAAEAVDGKYYTTTKGVLKWDKKTQSFVE